MKMLWRATGPVAEFPRQRRHSSRRLLSNSSIAGPGNRAGCPTNRLPSLAFTLIELLVVLSIVAVLAGTGLPLYQRVVQGSRATACMSNLRQIGAALQLYLNDHNMVMPPLKAGRASLSEDVPVLDNTLNVYATNPKVFACPADNAGCAATTGTSYFWNPALSGQAVGTLSFFRRTDNIAIPVASDKQAFHPYTATKVNILYADGHTDINFVTSTPAP